MHLLTFIKIFHLMGLILGLGGAVFLDFSILTRGILRPVSNYTVHHAENLSKIVSIGLAILWVTGIVLIALNLAEKPEYLTNQKLWAKIAIVVALTVNGFYIHHSVLPFMKRRLGRRLFSGLKLRNVGLFTLVASISFVSWTVPFVLGKASELNYVTPMWEILAVYAGCVAAMWLGMFTFAASLTKLQTLALSAAARSVPENAPWENAEFGSIRQRARRLPAAAQQLEYGDDELVMARAPRFKQAA